jgi:hypothetical protein
MNRRRSTKGLNRDQVNELHRGWEHARRIGCPLNAMLTFRPLEDYDGLAFCLFVKRVLNQLGVYARYRDFTFVAAWTRECNADGTGEHLHVLMHVPRRHFLHLEETIIGWLPAPGAAHMQPAHQKVFVDETGKRMSAIGYLAKQMTPQAWYKRGLIRKAGGPILGKRGGITRNIGAAAIERYFDILSKTRIHPVDRSDEQAGIAR